MPSTSEINQCIGPEAPVTSCQRQRGRMPPGPPVDDGLQVGVVKIKVCEVMPFTSAAPAMSSRSLRPSTVACGAGLQHSWRAKRRPAVSCCAAPMPQPSQLKRCGALRDRLRHSSRPQRRTR